MFRRYPDALIDQPFADWLVGANAILIGFDINQSIVEVENQALDSHEPFFI
jgi:hypothetical protein